MEHLVYKQVLYTKIGNQGIVVNKMNLFNLSSAQKMLLFSEINDPLNDSFYLNFRKDYALEDFEYVKSAIETISKSYLTLQIMHDENGDFKQYYADVNDFNVETFDVSDENVNDLGF
ncbi:hypothetical protein SAMN02910315_00157 [Methanobrevibacter millerae]|uniref:Uncharacterized protein n=2 Tax=Methanobrevibacter millerae TaxID=230361 RepID=A0A1G5UVQ3_9EURY|nr:hypothetical protein SAMN02910315_00157 [Methanobrevibacter millerae]